MSTDNKNTPPEDDELSAILKRLSEILDTSVSIDEGVRLAKNYNKHTESTYNMLNDNIPAEETESAKETEPVEAIESVEKSETIEEEFATSKIFDELLACFDGHKLPDDFRFSSINTVSNSSSEEKFEEGTPQSDKSPESLQETTPEASNEEQKNIFVPIEHAIPSEEDELFSEIFSEERAERKNREKDKKKWQSSGEEKSTVLLGIFDWLEVIVMSAAFALLLFTFVLRLAIVDGNSMNYTLHDKELLIISDLMYTPENNDIIVFSSPNYPEPIVKRIIATEGQTVDIDFQTWTVTVDGVVLEEDYINRVAGSMEYSDVTFPLTVDKGYVFVMGDNRNESLDSRNSRIGLVDERYILGEVKIRLFPFNRFGKVN